MLFNVKDNRIILPRSRLSVWDRLPGHRRRVPRERFGTAAVLKSYVLVKHFRKGKVIFEDLAPNRFHDEGEEWFLKHGLASDIDLGHGVGAWPTNWYLGLIEDTARAEADTLAVGITELAVANGYARQAVASTAAGWTFDGAGGAWTATSATVSFNATGTWNTANSLIMCDVASGTAGRLIASQALSTGRTLVNGDQLDASIILDITLEGVSP